MGSPIFMKGMGSTFSGEQRVSPIVTFSLPEKQMMSPTLALSTGTRFSPSICIKVTMRVL